VRIRQAPVETLPGFSICLRSTPGELDDDRLIGRGHARALDAEVSDAIDHVRRVDRVVDADDPDRRAVELAGVLSAA
jgi:hypothetical protein